MQILNTEYKKKYWLTFCASHGMKAAHVQSSACHSELRNRINFLQGLIMSNCRRQTAYLTLSSTSGTNS